MNKIILSISVLVLLSGCAVAGGGYKREKILLEKVKHPFKISGQDQMGIEKKFYIYPLINKDDMSVKVPSDIKNSLDELVQILGENLYINLMSLYVDGANPQVELSLDEKNELRKRLSNFLYNNWVDGNSEFSNLIQCIGGFEGNLSFLFILEAERYADLKELNFDDDFDDYVIELRGLIKDCQ